jgi:EAL domain-containing protein (putative c-di-GMP-specific phosphodiesterase class I)
MEPAGGEFSSRAQQWMPQLQLDPIVIDGIELHIAFKVGVAIYPGDGDDTDVLFKNAEAALQRAKETTAMCVFYSSEMNARVAERLRFETRLHRAVEQNQFELYYQPKVDMKTRSILGLEALIRWNDPEHGMISPLQFVPLLEQSGMIVDVGRWIFRQAMTDIRRWQSAGLVAPRVAVNVSQVQLQQRDFVEMVFAAIGYMKGQPVLCDLEITESLVMQDGEAGIEKLRRLRAAGMRIFMDDFGTGYSSLSQVTALPLDALKIDRSFISNMSRDMALISTIISLAHALKVDVVAEGVETEEQARVLLDLNCGQAQGYLFSRPVPAHTIGALLPRAT